jgi:UDP-2-acetamido-3-amino-2,3-dideoxy-glucuronate N-acetyltransferase
LHYLTNYIKLNLEKNQFRRVLVTIGELEEKKMKNDGYFVHESSFVDEDVIVGTGTKIWHFSHIQKGTFIGSNCILGQNVNIGNNVRIGNYVKIQNNVSVYEGVILEDYVFCGPSMVFTNILNPRSEFPQKGAEFYIGTRVGKSASLGANCTIVCGNMIGEYAFVGAGAVVIKDVPDFGLVVGNPAQLKGWFCKCGIRLKLSTDALSQEEAECTRCGRGYQKNEGSVKIVKERRK